MVMMMITAPHAAFEGSYSTDAEESLAFSIFNWQGYQIFMEPN